MMNVTRAPHAVLFSSNQTVLLLPTDFDCRSDTEILIKIGMPTVYLKATSRSALPGPPTWCSLMQKTDLPLWIEAAIPVDCIWGSTKYKNRSITIDVLLVGTCSCIQLTTLRNSSARGAAEHPVVTDCGSGIIADQRSIDYYL